MGRRNESRTKLPWVGNEDENTQKERLQKLKIPQLIDFQTSVAHHGNLVHFSCFARKDSFPLLENLACEASL